MNVHELRWLVGQLEDRGRLIEANSIKTTYREELAREDGDGEVFWQEKHYLHLNRLLIEFKCPIVEEYVLWRLPMHVADVTPEDAQRGLDANNNLYPAKTDQPVNPDNNLPIPSGPLFELAAALTSQRRPEGRSMSLAAISAITAAYRRDVPTGEQKVLDGEQHRNDTSHVEFQDATSSEESEDEEEDEGEDEGVDDDEAEELEVVEAKRCAEATA